MGRKGTAAIGRWGMTIIPSIPVFFSGLGKITDTADWSERFAGWGLPESLIVPIGVLEVAAVVAFLVPKSRFYGGAVVIATMLGAVGVHIAAGEWGRIFFPFAVAGVAAIATWWARPRWFHDMVVTEKAPEAPKPGESRRKPKS